MTPARIYDALAVAAFVASCVLYKRGRNIGGHRLLFLAWGMMISGYAAYAAMFHIWGLI